MQKSTRLKRLVLALLALTILTACGQKGDLYLPEGKAFLDWIG
jgi:predicted small lipoprotein YifL